MNREGGLIVGGRTGVLEAAALIDGNVDNFRNMYPTSLSGLQFNTQDTDAAPLTATVTMNYDLYKIEVL